MSNIHILTCNEISSNVEEYSVVFHIPVPIATNLLGIPYRAILKHTVSVDSPTAISWLNNPTDDPNIPGDPNEYQQIKDGIVFETPVQVVRAVKTETVPQKIARIEAVYYDIKDQLYDKFKEQYKAWGFNRNVT